MCIHICYLFYVILFYIFRCYTALIEYINLRNSELLSNERPYDHEYAPSWPFSARAFVAPNTYINDPVKNLVDLSSRERTTNISTRSNLLKAGCGADMQIWICLYALATLRPEQTVSYFRAYQLYSLERTILYLDPIFNYLYFWVMLMVWHWTGITCYYDNILPTPSTS